MRTWAALSVLVAVLAACAEPQSSCTEARISSDIESVLAASIAATLDQDIDANMALIPEDQVIRGEGGAIITRAQLKANVLRDWGVIPKTLAIEARVEALKLQGCDAAEVTTAQRWERLMFRPDRSGTDTILTTQRHREKWRRTPKGWRGYDVEELGGEIFVNGKAYTPAK